MMSLTLGGRRTSVAGAVTTRRHDARPERDEHAGRTTRERREAKRQQPQRGTGTATDTREAIDGSASAATQEGDGSGWRKRRDKIEYAKT